jgi:hypothetical protein
VPFNPNAINQPVTRRVVFPFCRPSSLPSSEEPVSAANVPEEALASLPLAESVAQDAQPPEAVLPDAEPVHSAWFQDDLLRDDSAEPPPDGHSAPVLPRDGSPEERDDFAVASPVDDFPLVAPDDSAVAAQVVDSSPPEVQDGSLPADSRATVRTVPVVQHFAEHPGAPS